jgi:hypothetical protein
MLQINNAISDTMDEIGTIDIIDGDTVTVYVEGCTELSEGVPDTPLIQVYPETGIVDMITATDRHTFRGGGRAEEQTWNIDAYATRRAHIGEDFKALLPLIDAVTGKLEEQDVKNYFGLSAIQSFAWTWQRSLFVFAQAEYVGCRFIVTVRIF